MRPNVASGGLSMEWHLPLAIFLYPLDLVFNNNGLVDHVLEVCVEQLELNVIIQSIQEHALFLLISVDVVRGISR
jgi:ribosomal protein L25 (general stress protein Ctc)